MCVSQQQEKTKLTWQDRIKKVVIREEERQKEEG